MKIGRARASALAGLVFLTGCGLGVDDKFPLPRATDNIHPIAWGRAYRSAQVDASTLGLLVDVLGLKTVFNLRGENDGETWYENEKALLASKGVELIDVRMSAHELPAREELLRLYDGFLAAEEPILIHCNAGADRAGAAAAIWRMAVLGESRATAKRELKVRYGHFEFATPEMDELVNTFEPDRAWIVDEYAP
jgi:protein tyrosine/serine phosphatase